MAQSFFMHDNLTILASVRGAISLEVLRPRSFLSPHGLLTADTFIWETEDRLKIYAPIHEGYCLSDADNNE